MNRQEFRAFYSACRKRNWSQEIQHNGRRWTIGRHDCQRLGATGCYDRVGALALCMNHAADARRRMKLKGATRGLLSLAREMRHVQETCGKGVLK